MKNRLLKTVIYTLLLALIFISCEKENQELFTELDQNSIEDQSKIISEINRNEKSITFIINGDNFGIMEKFPPHSSPLLDGDYKGLTLTEVLQKLDPSKKISEELYGFENTIIFPEEEIINEVENETFNTTAKGLNDAWFSNNYCNPGSSWNGYNLCKLNRYGPNGDWAYTSCYSSEVYVYPFQGDQIRIKGKIKKKVIFDYDIVSGYVHRFYMLSGSSIWYGKKKKHKYNIYTGNGDGWHYSLRSSTP